MAPGEVELMSTSSTLAVTMLHVTMNVPLEVIEEKEESEVNGGSAAGNETGTGIENAGGQDPESAADALVLEKEIGKGTELLQVEKRELLQTGEGSVRGSVGEMTAGVGRGVENGRGGAGAEIGRETGREGRVWMERNWGT